MSSFKYWILKNAPEVANGFMTHYRVVWPSTKKYSGVYDFVGSPDPEALEKSGLGEFLFETDRAEEYLMRVISAGYVIDSLMSIYPKSDRKIAKLRKRATVDAIDIVAYPWDITKENLLRIIHK